MVAVLLFIGGCATIKRAAYAGGHPPSGSGHAKPVAPLLKRFYKATKSPIVIVYKLTLPVGTFSGNRKVWRSLNEDVVSASTAVILAENGLRAAEAPRSRWPAIARLINVQGSLTQPIVCQSDGRSALTLRMRGGIAREMLAYVDRREHEVCRTFHLCDDDLMMAMRLRQDGRATEVSLEPVVNLGTVSMKRNGVPLGVVGGSRQLIEPFSDLQLTATVRRKNFLVLCPSAPKQNRFSIGSQFFSHTKTLPETETVLILVPVR